jgi:hypothetical protein
MAYQLYRFGNSQLLPLGDPRDLVAGADVQSDAVAVAGGVTHYAYGDGIIPLGLHNVPHRGIYSENVQTNVDGLMGLLGQRLQLWRRRLSDSALQWKYAKLTSCRWQRDKEQSQHAEVDATFEAEGAWKASALSSAARTGAGVLSVGASGKAWIWDATLTFVASSTTTHTWTVTDVTAGCNLTWSGSVNSGQSVVIDSGAWAVTKAGADAYSSLTINSGHAAQRLLVISPAGQSFVFSVAAGGGTFTLRWYPQWV